jgi:hypothetical protein
MLTDRPNIVVCDYRPKRTPRKKRPRSYPENIADHHHDQAGEAAGFCRRDKNSQRPR